MRLFRPRKKLRLNQVRRNAGAVHGNKGLAFAQAALMNSAGKGFLAYPGFALKKDCNFTGRLFQQIAHIVVSCRFANRIEHGVIGFDIAVNILLIHSARPAT